MWIKCHQTHLQQHPSREWGPKWMCQECFFTSVSLSSSLKCRSNIHTLGLWYPQDAEDTKTSSSSWSWEIASVPDMHSPAETRNTISLFRERRQSHTCSIVAKFIFASTREAGEAKNNKKREAIRFLPSTSQRDFSHSPFAVRNTQSPGDDDEALTLFRRQIREMSAHSIATAWKKHHPHSLLLMIKVLSPCLLRYFRHKLVKCSPPESLRTGCKSRIHTGSSPSHSLLIIISIRIKRRDLFFLSLLKLSSPHSL